MIAFVTSHFALCVVGVFILVFLGLGIGYMVGNNVYNKSADEKVSQVIKKLEYQGEVRASIIDNVGLGVITYNSTGVIYNNKTIENMPGFLKEGVPPTIEDFLDKFEQENHLKSDYLLNLDSSDGAIRVNYNNDGKIFEIKILHRKYDGDRLDIVIVDDITQIKDDERRQKDLAANVSHELKTPLTVIRASEFFVNNITPDNMPEYDEIKKWGTRIVSNAIRMQDIVQDFLTLSMCQDAVPMTIVDVGEIINNAVSAVSEYPGRDKVTITVPENMYYPLVFGNSNLLMRVIINLLTNAIKYSGYEGKTEADAVDIKVSPIDDRIAIEVSDNGRGVSQEDQRYLFERFFRVDNSGSRDAGGTGIGLSIVRDIVNMHDGSITVSSEPGQGSSFTVVLPLAAGLFENIYEDAKSGVISGNTYYTTAADFIALHAVEAVKSMGYDDLMETVNQYEEIPSGEKTLRDKKLAQLISAMGEERYLELVDELTFIDPDMMDGEEVEDEVPIGLDIEEDAAPETEDDVSDEPAVESEEEVLRRTQEEEDKIRREEAKAILTQQILPRAVPSGAQETRSQKEAVTVHPSGTYKKNTTSKRKKKGSLFLDLTAVSEDNNETEIKSAVKQVLDETEGK